MNQLVIKNNSFYIFKTITYIVFLYLIYPAFLGAVNLSWSAETRLKIENYHDDSTSTSATASYFRGRINFDLRSDIYKVYFQLQDSRLLGNQNNLSGQARLNNTYPTFHQFYGQVSGPFNGKNKIRFGRFEMPLGNQRLFARNGWNNYGRSFEGITNTKKTRRGDILFFHLINTELYPMNDQFDYIIDGLYGTVKPNIFTGVRKQSIDSDRNEPIRKPMQLEYYIFNENIVVSSGENTKRRQTFGLRVVKEFSKFNIESEFAYQTGQRYSDNIEASLFSLNIEVPINFIPLTESVSFTKEYISGRENQLKEAGGTFGAFAKPFGSGHKYHGYYDNPLHKSFTDNSHAGLDEWYIKTKHQVFPKTDLVIKYHSFKDGINVNTYGNELDFVLTKKLRFGGKIIQGYSIYFPEGGGRLEAGYFMLLFNI